METKGPTEVKLKFFWVGLTCLFGRGLTWACQALELKRNKWRSWDWAGYGPNVSQNCIAKTNRRNRYKWRIKVDSCSCSLV